MEWILLADREPPVGHPVLLSDGHCIATGSLEKLRFPPTGTLYTYWSPYGLGGYECEWDFEPTHWAELPDPPKEV